MQNKTAFLLFPTQLYETLEDLPPRWRNADIILVEDPVFYFDPVYKPFRVNKIKIAFLHACISAYLKYQKNTKTTLVSFHDIQSHGHHFLKSYTDVVMYNPIDHDLAKKYQNICKQSNIKLTMLESPDLLINQETMQKEYYDVKKDKVRHASFYDFMKTKLNVLKDVSNLDKMNRSPPPKETPNMYKYIPSKDLIPIYKDAITFANNKHFQLHCGSPEHVVMYPISHKESQKTFDIFLKQRFELFGKFEDAIMQEDPFMYHSVISPLLNVGLLTPRYVLEKTLQFYGKNKNTIPLSSLEGFLRQIIGWRVFMQSLYMFKCQDLLTSNTPNNNNYFKDWTIWYNGETGIKPLDEEIKKAVKYGYSHHIVRLMVFMNFFILCEVHPSEIYRWFMEVVSMDAYSWVMISNIYAMGYFFPKVMTKPYLSTSNYICKMSNYKRDGHWDIVWDALYREFVKSKPSTYTFFYKRTASKSNNHRQLAIEFINKHFTSKT
jgi:deoxyribodipyrimidine photolyase-related protein